MGFFGPTDPDKDECSSVDARMIHYDRNRGLGIWGESALDSHEVTLVKTSGSCSSKVFFVVVVSRTKNPIVNIFEVYFFSR